MPFCTQRSVPRGAGVRNSATWSSGTHLNTDIHVDDHDDSDNILSLIEDSEPGPVRPPAPTIDLLSMAKVDKRKRPQGASLAKASGFEFVKESKDSEWAASTQQTDAKAEEKKSLSDEDDEEWECIEHPNAAAKTPSRPLYSAMLKVH